MEREREVKIRREKERMKMLQKQEEMKILREKQVQEHKEAEKSKHVEGYKSVISNFKEQYTRTKVLEQKLKYQINKTKATVMNTLEISENVSAMIEYINGIKSATGKYEISFKKLKACVPVVWSVV